MLLAFFLPDSTIVAEFRRPLNIEDRVNKLQGQLETLEEEKILDIEKVEAIKLNLERIQKDAEGLGPDKTLDALRHLENQVQQKADEAAEQGLKDAETLSKAESLTEEAKKYSESLSREEADSLMQGLAEMLNEMFENDPGLFEKLAGLDSGDEKSDAEKSDGSDKDSSEKNGDKNKSSDGKKGDKSGSKRGGEQKGEQKIDSEQLKKMLQNKKLDNLSKEQLEQLQKSMQQCKECDKEMLQKLIERGMLDSKMLDQFEELEKVDEEELQRMLDELGCGQGGDGECDCEGECDGTCPKGRPGRGGISRGRGDAPITFDDEESSEEGTEFQSQILPPPALEELKNSLKFGSSRAAPELNPEGSTSDQGGAVGSVGEGIGSAHGQTILPQHRGPIGRYFERNR